MTPILKYKNRKNENEVVDVLFIDPIKEMVTYEFKTGRMNPYDEDETRILEDHFDDFFEAYERITPENPHKNFIQFYNNEYTRY